MTEPGSGISPFFSTLFAKVKLDPKVARAYEEARWILSLLRAREMTGKPRILDLGCGQGRVTIALAEEGAAMTGLDVNDEYLAEAERRAAVRGAHIRWLRCDDRKLAAQDEYEAVVSLFTSFGYHDDAGNDAVLANVARALVPGGLFIVETQNRDHPGTPIDGAAVEQADNGMELLKTYRFDPWTSRRQISFRFMRDGSVSDGGSLQIRLYALHEIAAASRAVGMEPVAVYGSARGAPFTANGEKLVFVAAKAAV